MKNIGSSEPNFGAHFVRKYVAEVQTLQAIRMYKNNKSFDEIAEECDQVLVNHMQLQRLGHKRLFVCCNARRRSTSALTSASGNKIPSFGSTTRELNGTTFFLTCLIVPK